MTPEITIEVHGASPEEIERGIAAAQAVFDAAGVSARDAAEALSTRDCWDDDGFAGEEPTAAELQNAELWDLADQAAVDACCAGWYHQPETAYMRLTVLPPAPEWLAGLAAKAPQPARSVGMKAAPH